MCLNFIKKTRFGLVTLVTIEPFKGEKEERKENFDAAMERSSTRQLLGLF